MNKKFYFGLALTAGLFASCSSDDLVGESASSQAFIDNGAPAKIEIGLTPGYEITRGTGRVGDATAAANAQWEGQEFHVLMLEKGTMLGARTTADDPTTAIIKGAPFTATGSNVIALDNDAVFYPTLKRDGTSVGVYDFWGYRLDDAATTDPETFNGYDVVDTGASYTWGAAQTTAPTGVDAGDIGDLTAAPTTATVGVQDKWYKYTDNNGTPDDDTDDVLTYVQCTAASAGTSAATQITVPFIINGTQDLMVATTSASDATYAAANPDLIFSAKSARNGVKPNLAFKHLLTSLTFKVKPKSRDITDQADNPTTDPRFVPGYQITNITLKSMATGELIVAYTGAEPAERIVWGAAQNWAYPATLTPFQLQTRKKQVNDKADIKMVQISTATTASGTLTYTASYVDESGAGSYVIPAGGAPVDLVVYDSKDLNATTGLPEGNKTTIGALRGVQDYGWIRTYNSVPRAGGDFETTDDKNQCDYRTTEDGPTSDLVPFVANADVDKYLLKWHAPSTAATYKNTTEVAAADYALLPIQNKGGDVANATALDAVTKKENVHKVYHQTDIDKYYKIEVNAAATWTTDDDVATDPTVIGKPMLVAPSNDVANSGYQATVTYKYYKKQDTKTVVETTKTTDPFVINNYTVTGGNKVKGAFEAGKNYNVTITLYSDGEVVNGEATSEPWTEGGDLDAGDDN